MNIKSHKIFNDKFMLNVLSLNQIELATEEDIYWGIDTWARVFKAKTWEELKMLANNNDLLMSAANSIFELNTDELIREQCRAREEYERHERTMQRTLAEQEKTIHEQTTEITDLKAQLESALAEIDKLKRIL